MVPPLLTFYRNLEVNERNKRRLSFTRRQPFFVNTPLQNGNGNTDTGYPHDGRADNAAYRHDRRADKRRYPHDREIDIQMLNMF